MTIAGVFMNPDGVKAQTNNSKNNTTLNQSKEKISINKYYDIIKEREEYLKQVDKENEGNDWMDMTAHEYFVESQKKTFLKSCEMDRYGMKGKIKEIQKLLKEKFEDDIDYDPILILKYSLKKIAEAE